MRRSEQPGGPRRRQISTGQAELPRDAAGLPVRRAALEILVRVARERAFADVLLGHRIGRFAAADRRLITQLVLGTIAWQGRLDYELAAISARELDSLAPEIIAILRMALFQIRILTRIPRHAAVDTAVTLAREARAGAGAAGFVNAVLRNALRRPAELPPRAQDEIGHLAVAYSHPRWLAARFVEWFGVAEAESLMAANNLAAPNVIRLNLARGDADGISAELANQGFEIAASGRFPETLILQAAPPVDSAAFRAGLCYPQAEASQLVARMLAPAPGAAVIDCAAAPGGKSAHLAEMAGPSGKVVALDLNFAGLRKVHALASRLGHRNIHVARADASSALPMRPRSFDYVLLDAPCTGTGTMREHPEIRWRLQPGDFVRMTAIQSQMIDQAAALVCTGGALVYSVCSIAPEEGPEVVRSFLARNHDFAVDPPPNRECFAGLLDAAGAMRTRPDRGGLDGFFAARLTRSRAR